VQLDVSCTQMQSQRTPGNARRDYAGYLRCPIALHTGIAVRCQHELRCHETNRLCVGLAGNREKEKSYCCYYQSPFHLITLLSKAGRGTSLFSQPTGPGWLVQQKAEAGSISFLRDATIFKSTEWLLPDDFNPINYSS